MLVMNGLVVTSFFDAMALLRMFSFLFCGLMPCGYTCLMEVILPFIRDTGFCVVVITSEISASPCLCFLTFLEFYYVLALLFSSSLEFYSIAPLVC